MGINLTPSVYHHDLLDGSVSFYEIDPGLEIRTFNLATILAMNPRILLLDEPTLGLDEPTVEKTIGILQPPQLSYIIISQNREFLRRTTNKLHTIQGGDMKDLGTTKKNTIKQTNFWYSVIHLDRAALDI